MGMMTPTLWWSAGGLAGELPSWMRLIRWWPGLLALYGPTCRRRLRLLSMLGWPMLGHEAQGFGDCWNVVRDAQRLQVALTNPRRRYAGLLSAVAAEPGWRWLGEVQWVPGHLREKIGEARFCSLPPQEQRRARGNEKADEVADHGRAQHERPGRQVEQHTSMLVAHVRSVCK